MAAWSVALESRRGRKDLLEGQVFWTRQNGGLAGIGVRAPAQLALRSETLESNEGVRCCSSIARYPRFEARARRPAGYERGVTAEIVTELCEQSQLTAAVEALGALVQTGYRFSKTLFYTVLRQCVVKKDLVLGRRVHALIGREGYGSDTFLCNHILRMYASHGKVQEAMDVFTMVSEPDAFMWSSMMSAHVKYGQSKEAIELYNQMRRTSVKPDGHVFVAALQACGRVADLETGQQVHADVLASGVEPDLFVCNSLVDMYAKCGMGQEALRLYSDMQQDGMGAPDRVTFVCLLQACASLGAQALDKGKQLHAQIGERRLQGDMIVGCSLVNMYAKCGSLHDARTVFHGLGVKDVVTWNAIITGYAQQGMGEEAIHLYSAMQEEGITAPDSVTFVSLLQACASLGTRALDKGKELHAQIGEVGLQADVVVGCSLVNMYAKCGSLLDAQSVFDRLPKKTVVTWTALIAGYSQQGMGREALHLYSAMEEEGIAAPNSVTFACLLQACASVGPAALEKGKLLHGQIGLRGLQIDVGLGNSLINMYAKCGSLQDGQSVFDRLDEKDVVTWNALIAGYSQQGLWQEALHLFSGMQEEGIAAHCVTFVCLLQACAGVAALQAGRELHAQIEQQGLQADATVSNSLINMYAKSGSMIDAQQVFDELLDRGIITWNALIAGYARQGDANVVFNLVDRMENEGIQPDDITFLSLLTVCSHAGLVDKGQDYFETMSRHYGIIPTAEHYTCMVDILGRAGQLNEALALARRMPVQPQVTVWNTLLGACQKWSNVEVGRCAFDEAVRVDEKDPIAYVSMSNIYAGAQMWEEAQEMQANRTGIGAWKQPGQSWWTDMDGLVHTFVVGHKKHPKSEAVHICPKRTF